MCSFVTAIDVIGDRSLTLVSLMSSSTNFMSFKGAMLVIGLPGSQICVIFMSLSGVRSFTLVLTRYSVTIGMPLSGARSVTGPVTYSVVNGIPLSGARLAIGAPCVYRYCSGARSLIGSPEVCTVVLRAHPGG